MGEFQKEFYIGYKFSGEITRIKRFGIFVYLGYQVIDGYKLSGIIDIATKPDYHSSGLPTDTTLWPKSWSTSSL